MDYSNEHITTLEDAVNTLPENHPDRWMHLYDLGDGLLSRFERTQCMDDLNRGLNAIEETLNSMPNDPYRVACLLFLSNALQSRFKRTGSIDD